MNKETVIALAQEAHGAMLASGRGMYLWHGEAYAGDVQDFCERFAALVAKAERHRICEMLRERHKQEERHNYYGFIANMIEEMP